VSNIAGRPCPGVDQKLIVAVASGKGGTGKTTVAVNLALVWEAPVQLLDCDVEEPNVHLFIGYGAKTTHPVTVPVPRVDETQCDGCAICADVCEFNAIAVASGIPIVFDDLCHGCGGCTIACPQMAITEVPRQVGVVERWSFRHVDAVAGRLDIGVPTAPPIIRAVKSHTSGHGVTIVDAPPGTSCPVIASVRDADFVVLVTEPTPFGLHDLSLSVDVMRRLGLEFGIVINRADLGDDRTERFCREQEIPVLMRIPNDRRIAEVYSRGGLIVDELPEYHRGFRELAQTIWSVALVQKG
jgi:MinD superfamily P-loop ATPase